ncbi:MAG: class I SAM-dependent rRNA methyltransferase, partial [Bacteroidota bacterium]
MKSIQLAKGRAKSIQRKHPWIFSGGVAKEDPSVEEGDRVNILDAGGNRLGIGHYQKGSIRVRMLYFGREEQLASDFWITKLATARKLRRQLYLIRPDNTTYRLIHGAGDGLPGLIIDIYGKVAVVQCHSIGMFRERQQIASALCKVFGEELEMIYNRSGRTLSSNFQTEEKME